MRFSGNYLHTHPKGHREIVCAKKWPLNNDQNLWVPESFETYTTDNGSVSTTPSGANKSRACSRQYKIWGMSEKILSCQYARKNIRWRTCQWYFLMENFTRAPICSPKVTEPYKTKQPSVPFRTWSYGVKHETGSASWKQCSTYLGIPKISSSYWFINTAGRKACG